MPKDLVATTGDLPADGGAGAWILDDITVELDRTKLYWLCVLAKNVTSMPVIGTMESVFYFNVLGFSSTAFQSFFGLKVPFAFGAFPATFPTVNDSHLAAGVIAAAGVRYNA